MSPEQSSAVKKITEFASCSEEEALAVILEFGIKAVTLSAYNIQRPIDDKKRREEKQVKGRFLYWFPSSEIYKSEPVPSEASWRSALGLEPESQANQTPCQALQP